MKASFRSTDNLADTDEHSLLEPFIYLCQNPGKEIRTKLIDAFDYWLKVPSDKLAVVREVTEMLHTASLLIDDVEDASALRRGVPVAHKIFGVPRSINCANYVYFLALERVLALKNDEAVQIFTSELLNLHRGQGMELYWRDSGICPSEKNYLEMVGNKTGGLLRLAVKLMQTLAPDNDRDFVPLIDLMGVHFQIRDDYCNLKSDVYSGNKGFAEDLTEGKFSFPIIHSINAKTQSSTQLKNILAQHTTDVDLKNYAITIMQKSKSFDYTLKIIQEYESRVRKEIESFGGNQSLVKIVDLLSKL